MCLPSDALLQHLPSYLDSSYLGRGVSIHGCSSKAQLLLLTLDEGCLLTAALPDLQEGIWDGSSRPSCAQAATAPRDAPPCRAALASGKDGSSQLPPLALGSVWLLRVTAPGLGREVASPSWP